MPVTTIPGDRIRAGAITDSNINASAAIALSKLAKAVIAADGTQAATASIPMGNNKITGMAAGSQTGEAVTFEQLSAVQGNLNFKANCKVATTANLSVTASGTGVGKTLTANANGVITVDGVSLSLNDRVLVKDQTTGSDNGIYTVTTVGDGSHPFVLTRATDADQNAEVLTGLSVYIEQGTTNGTLQFTLSTTGSITVDTTSLAFVITGGKELIYAGNGLTSSGNTVNVVAGDASVTVDADDIKVALSAIAATLGLHSDGLKIADATSSYIPIGQGNGTPTAFKAISGDISISNTGAVTISVAFLKYANVITSETPGGSINGSNTTFTLANTPQAGTVKLYRNGMRMNAGSGNDYTISSSTITMASAPVSGDVLIVDYLK